MSGKRIAMAKKGNPKGKNRKPDGMAQKSVVVIGAGIVGVATAIWLQRAGHHVTLVDRDGPAAGASAGNGGVLASCSIIPVTVPGLVRKAPRMALDPKSPLFLRWSYLPKLLPWLIPYLGHAKPEKTRATAKAMTPLLHDSLQQHQALAAGTPAEKHIRPSHYVYGYRTREAYEADAFGWNLRKEMGFQWQEMDAKAFGDFDPAFEGTIGFGAVFEDHGYVNDPAGYMKALAKHMVDQGGVLRQVEVQDILRRGERVEGIIADGEEIACDDLVIATGVWSGPLARKLGIHVPLESERGYHIELVNPSVMPKAPTMITESKFVATPMDGRIRCAGIVEFGGTEAEPSRAPFALLKEQIERAIPGIRYDRIDEWMGHRPAPVDSIPCIGPIGRLANAHAAFGHHHVGLTGGAKTGRIVADLISGTKMNLDLAPYSISRFE